jgi:uncharacterized Tic20 family protein
MTTTHQKNIAALTHLSALSKFVFPLGNFIMPLALWILNKDKSEFIDKHGKQAINFQLSILLYSIIIASLTIPLFIFGVLDHFSFPEVWRGMHHNINLDIDSAAGIQIAVFAIVLVFLALVATVFEIIFIIIATSKANNGELYNYPITINFLK